jgi:hypothetical protein
MANYDPTARLKEVFLGSAGKFEFTGSDAITTMVLIRELVEFRSRKKELAVLNLYCNWTVHPESMGSLIGSRFLAGAAAALGPKRDWAAMNGYVASALSLSSLRAELIETFHTHAIPTRNFELKTGWRMFCAQYFKSMMYKRLRFPAKLKGNPKAAEIHRDMLDRADGDASRIVHSIRFKDSSRNSVQWAVEFADGTELCGALDNP